MKFSPLPHCIKVLPALFMMEPCHLSRHGTKDGTETELLSLPAYIY